MGAATELVQINKMENFWRTVALMAVSGAACILLGQFMPNRSVVTADQLVQINARLDRIESTAMDTKTQLQFIRGEVESKRRLGN